MLASGYLQTRFSFNRAIATPFHTNLGYIFTAFLVFHFSISVFLLRYPWRRTLKSVKSGSLGGWTLTRLIQRVSAWIVLVSALILVISGLGWYSFNFWKKIPFHPHVRYDLLMGIGLIIHVLTGVKVALARNRISLPVNKASILLALILISAVFYVDRYMGVKAGEKETPGEPSLDDDNISSNPILETNSTKPSREGKIVVGFKTLKFDPGEVETLRPDIFKPGFFSIFDVLAHVSEKGLIDLKYHFDESMNTHVIDSLEGEPNWWYIAYYSGGWEETNYFRPDHYPWKDGTNLRFFTVSSSRIELTQNIFRGEVTRRKKNDDKIIVPKVIIRGRSFKLEYDDVEVTPHNLRNDVFQEGVMTAIDVILSLGDQDKIEYTLKWYESIGTAQIVKNYWVEGINQDVAHGRCGFVYESGDSDLDGFAGNHIHLPSDTRVLNSPEYVMYFWICI
jgi:hypothetical protein